MIYSNMFNPPTLSPSPQHTHLLQSFSGSAELCYFPPSVLLVSEVLLSFDTFGTSRRLAQLFIVTRVSVFEKKKKKKLCQKKDNTHTCTALPPGGPDELLRRLCEGKVEVLADVENWVFYLSCAPCVGFTVQTYQGRCVFSPPTC